MNEQYYYSFLYLLRQTVELLEKYWWWWVAKVHAYPLTAITIVLMGILILMIYGIRRKGVVTVVVGNELHDLIRAMREEKPNTSQSK